MDSVRREGVTSVEHRRDEDDGVICASTAYGGGRGDEPADGSMWVSPGAEDGEQDG